MRVAMIIAQKGYHPIEYGTSKRILESAKIEVVTASKKYGVCTDNRGDTVEASITLDEIDVSVFDAIIFIGGPGSNVYQHDKEAHRIAKDAVKKKKFLGAICMAPTILAYAGVLKGKKATVWNDDGKQEKIFKKNGVIYIKKDVVIDDKIITANAPSATIDFAKILTELIFY
jgi:protease I